MLQNTAVILGIAVSSITIVSFLGIQLGKELERRVKDKEDHTYLKECAKTQAQVSKHTLRLVFTIANEMVKQGANGELKKAVCELRNIVIEEAMHED